MKKNAVKKDLIYHYLIQGYPACKIKEFKDINCTKGYISQVVRQLVSKGYIQEVLEKTPSGKLLHKKPKLYSKTHKQYPSKFSDLTSRVSVDHVEQPRLNLICLYYHVVSKPKKEVMGHSWTINNTRYVDVKHVFPEGRVTFRIINEGTLVVFMPEVVVRVEDLRHTRQRLFVKAQEYANWFQKTFGCSLGLPEIRQDYHIAVGERDPFLMELCKDYGLVKVLDEKDNVLFWWDRSKGFLEFETKSEKIAENRVLMPLVVENLQDRVFLLTSEVEALSMVFEGFEEKIRRVETGISSLTGSIEVLNGKLDVLLHPPSRPDEGLEVA